MEKDGEKICPKCDAIMTTLCVGETRLVGMQLVTLPGEPMGHKCEKCGYEDITNPLIKQDLDRKRRQSNK